MMLVAALPVACGAVLPDDTRPPGVYDHVRQLDLMPRQPTAVAAPAAPEDSRAAVEYVAPASGQALASGNVEGGGVTPGFGGGGYDLNFDNAPLTNVAKVVLGDILGQSYVIDPRVQGTISLASGRPVPKSELLYVLEAALRTSGNALVRDASGYRIVPMNEAAGAGSTDSAAARAEPGYGLSVVPLRYVSAQTLLPLLDGFGVRTGAVRVDPGRNILLIQGPGTERRSLIDTVMKFDADWMRGQSVGIYPVKNSAPEPIISELEKLMDSGEGGLSANLVKLQPINRLNAIMVVTGRADMLRTAATWIARLDRADTTTAVRVYRLRYGEARQIAKVLNDLFLGQSSAGLDLASSQIAPGSGVQSSSSGPGGQALSVAQKLGAAPVNPEPARAAAEPEGPGPAPGTGGGGALLSGVRITADQVNNSLLIYASQENYRIIERTIAQLDQQQLQVAIEATVAEVTLNDTLAYGVQFYLTSKDLGLGRNNGSALNTLSSEITDQAINRVLPGFNLLVGRENQPKMILDALHTVTDVKVLSNPSLVVVDNQPATLQVGDEVPVSTGSATVLSSSNTVVNTIEYKNTGIILRVVPRVNVNGQVRLEVEQEISNVTQETATGSGASASTTTLTPTVSQRKVKSTIVVTSGQTVLLAGLINERHNGNRQGVPGLDQVPVVGDAFSHRTGTIKRTELIIFIRPQIIRDGFDAHTVAEEVRAKLRGSIAVAPGGPPALPPNFPRN